MKGTAGIFVIVILVSVFIGMYPDFRTKTTEFSAAKINQSESPFLYSFIADNVDMILLAVFIVFIVVVAKS